MTNFTLLVAYNKGNDNYLVEAVVVEAEGVMEVVEDEVVEHYTEPGNTDNIGSVGTGLVGIRVDSSTGELVPDHCLHKDHRKLRTGPSNCNRTSFRIRCRKSFHCWHRFLLSLACSHILGNMGLMHPT